MNKKGEFDKYIKSMNKVEVGDKMKKDVLNKIRPKQKTRYNWFPRLGAATVVVALMLAIILPLGMERNTEEGQLAVLPTIDSFENLQALLGHEGSDFGRSRFNDDHIFAIGGPMDDAVVSESDGIRSSRESTTPDHSTTNIQVEGVDEADIVKTDGNYIYYISNSRIVIIDASDPKNLRIASQIEYEWRETESFSPFNIYLTNDKLVVIGTRWEERGDNYWLDLETFTPEVDVISTREDSVELTIVEEPIHRGRRHWWGGNVYTVARVYDIRNRDNVRLERVVEVEGEHLTSRMIGDNLYLVANQNIRTYRFDIYPIYELSEDAFKPSYRDTAVGEGIRRVDFSYISYFPDSISNSYLNIIGFNINNNEKANVESILGGGDIVYCSGNNLYVTRTTFEHRDSIVAEIVTGDGRRMDMRTHIYKFALNNSEATFITSGAVPGRLLNQFSMGEYNGYFRVVTTDNDRGWWSPEHDMNNVYVLDMNLDIVGRVEGLAPGESIFAARFMGDRIYMITFVEIDPLFVIDVSDPRNPIVLGELKIPWFSTYLHPYDENHLLGIGEDVELVNGWVLTNGIKLTLFDVTDESNPTARHYEKIGGRGTHSEVLHNHRAFLFSKERDIIAFPITITEDWRWEPTFVGVVVYGLDLDGGFTLRGKITHMPSNNRSWVDWDREIQRILYIGDSLITVSRGMVMSTDINTMQEIDSLEF
ncbi:MAG: beta-propeller domain-containing protein [Oscillospiraceae bacterium]|nr:beta-propeller domain-containing protein [Oscillospiraceae bacterium]